MEKYVKVQKDGKFKVMSELAWKMLGASTDGFSFVTFTDKSGSQDETPMEDADRKFYPPEVKSMVGLNIKPKEGRITIADFDSEDIMLEFHKRFPGDVSDKEHLDKVYELVKEYQPGDEHVETTVARITSELKELKEAHTGGDANGTAKADALIVNEIISLLSTEVKPNESPAAALQRLIKEVKKFRIKAAKS